jgi:hypothetical protein
MPCEYCESINEMTGRRHCPIHAEFSQALRPEWIDETTWRRAFAITPPPIAGEADTEYESRLDAERVSLEWRAAIRASGKQYGTDDLPLFGGTRQGSLF